MEQSTPTISPVVLCGGSGTRLWPLSRESYPKQFVSLVGEQTLFQASALRLMGTTTDLRFGPPVILTGNNFRFIVSEQLHAVGVDPAAILIEPDGRDTGPAVLAAALHLHETDPDAIMLVAPSDHVIEDTAAFHRAVARGLERVLAGDLVTFGITPDRPETGYGYLELSAAAGQDEAPVALSRFVEKPNAPRAIEMLAAGNFLWNAGIFLFRVQDIIAAFEAHASALVAPVKTAVDQASVDLGFLRLDSEAWTDVTPISIDYAVMEKAGNLSVVPFSGGWSDLGGWDAVWRETGPDAQGVVAGPRTTAIECQNSLLRADSDQVELVGIGLENIMAISTGDAVLVADMSRAQDVKTAVSALQRKQVPQAVQFPKEHRPWGWFERLVTGSRFQVKRILVHPGASLSLQSHVHRSEHWIVVVGTARVTVGDEVKLVTENESVYIPLGTTHRLENPGKFPMVLIEVQTGAYVGEDDIVRYDDVYARK
jgi:mannose-1-phosphate guanylyltransferase/mannose-6-phosphate isomerase